MRVMCDSTVLARAIISHYDAAAALLEIIAREHTLVTSPRVLMGLYELLRRPAVRGLHQLPDDRVRRAVAHLYRLSLVAAVPADLPLRSKCDPKDHPAVMTAILGKADVLCTGDARLHESATVGFCASYAVRVLRDLEVMAELQAGWQAM